MNITYDELVRRVPIWLYAQNRTLIDEMPALIGQAEDMLMLVLDHDLFRAALSPTTIGPGSPVLDLRAEDPQVMEVRAIDLLYRTGPGVTPLARRGIEAMRMMYAQARPARPRYYAESNDILTYEFFPRPGRDYDAQVTANIRPARLGPAQQTSVLTEQFSRAVEKAVLQQATLFMKNYEDAARYEGEMQQAVEEANLQVKRRRRDETGTRGRDTANTAG